MFGYNCVPGSYPPRQKAQAAAGNTAERDKLLEKHNGNNETALISINDEIMRLPEMKWGYSSIDRANKRIKEIEAMDVSEGTKESMIKYWEKFIDDTKMTSNTFFKKQ